MKKMIQLCFISILTLLIPILAGANYNYSYYGEVIHSAPGLHFATFYNSNMLGISLENAQDLIVYQNHMYIITSGKTDATTNSTDFGYLYVLNDRFEVVGNFATFELSEALKIRFQNEDKPIDPIALRRPEGLDVKPHGIYIADTGNKRIIKLNHQYEVIDIFDKVDDVTFDEVVFEPRKITTDTTGRMYVVAKNIFEGIIELDTDGSFNRYTGVNPLTLTPFEIFQRQFMTDEQISKLRRYLPTEYTNVEMNENNFIYATALPSENNSDNMVQLINPKGVDVLRRNGYHIPKGDIQFIVEMNNYVISGPSTLSDVAAYHHGIYTVLDSKRSRLFTYDKEGNLLYINGDIGAQSDRFNQGVAIDYFNDNLLILDGDLETIIVYEHTDFGQKVNEAVMYQEVGMYDEAALVWEEVLKLNTNYEVAYNGIGKYYLRLGDYQKAMDYFSIGKDKDNYSKAFKAYRNQMIKDNFGYIMLGLLFIPVSYISYKVIRKRKTKEAE